MSALQSNCLVAVMFCSGCATMAGGSSQSVTITSEPPGASVSITPGDIYITTPATVELDRSYDYVVNFEHPGYKKSSARINRTNSDELIENAFIPVVGFVGTITDALTDAEFTLSPDPLHVTLLESALSENDVLPPASTSSKAIKFFNRNERPITVYLQLDLDPWCKLERGQFVSFQLDPGSYSLNLYHWDIFKFSDSYEVEIDSFTTHVGVFTTVTATYYSFYDELPVLDFAFEEVDCGNES
ncbi:MAG: PEGA domain-containing protein [Pseudomonadota bacterium]